MRRKRTFKPASVFVAIFCAITLCLFSGCALVTKIFTAKPTVPRLLYPLYNEKDVTISPKLRWTGTGADVYYVYLGENERLDSGDLVAERKNKEYSPLPLAFNKTYYWRIDATNEGGTVSSEVGCFSTLESSVSLYPSEPSKVAETLVRQGSQYSAQLEWSALRADYYNVYFGENPEPELYLTRKAENQILIEGLTPYRAYYWRIEAVNAYQAVKSPVWNFDTSPTELLPVEALYPANDAADVDTALLLRWTETLCPVGGEVVYKLFFSNDSAFSPEKTLVESMSRNYFFVDQLDYKSDYYWKVEARSSAGQAPSEVFRFCTRRPLAQELPNIPDQPYPSDHSLIWTDTPVLTWYCERADAYELHFGTRPSSLTPVATSIQSKSFILQSCEPGCDYYWKIVASNRAGQTEGPVWTFRISAPLPGQAEALFPMNGDTEIGLSPSFLWSVNSDPKAIPILYDFYLGLTPLLGEPEKIGSDLLDAFYVGAHLEKNKRYYWKVVSKNTYGSAESSVFDFYTIGEETAANSSIPSFPYPADNASRVAKALTFAWNCDRATDYSFWFGLSPENLTQLQENLKSPTHQLSSLRPNTVYYWKVVASNSAGSVEGPVWRFKTEADALSAPRVISPSSGASGLELNPTLQWTPAVSPSGENVTYSLHFAENPLEIESALIAYNIDFTQFSLSELKRSAAYFWKVVARSDSAVSESNVYSFSTRGPTEDELPEVPKNPFPYSLSVDIPNSLKLTWESRNAEKYSLYIGTNPGDLQLIQTGITTPWFWLDSLLENAFYYWKVVASNVYGFTEGPIWVFETGKEDEEPPKVLQATLSLPYIADGSITTGTIEKLGLRLQAEDDTALKSFTVDLFYRRKGQSAWDLLAQVYEKIDSATPYLERKMYFTLSASPGEAFEEIGEYELYASIVLEDVSGKTSSPYSTEKIGIEVYMDSPPMPYDIEGKWSGSFSIVYIVEIKGSIDISIKAVSTNLFTVTVTFEGKKYTGEGRFDRNGDLRGIASIEGVSVLLLGKFDSPTSISGSVFLVGNNDKLNRLGSWQAIKQ
ncbi:MAG TPA: hypothetical protein PKL87_03530 [Thermotogota bacterium]|jgi:hypothetical protein|nr:hypothetical protein [Thermotogota bacterium]HOH13390.1 hypothetical protein [Thermotogota bacterium]